VQISEEALRRRKAFMAGLESDRQPWWPHWRTLADYILPKRYEWLLNPQERQNRMSLNPNILDGTGTQAARTCASGMMNGVTSPSRQWFKLRIAGFNFDEDSAAGAWLDEVERRMLLVMAESNFYNALAVMYLDLVVFGTSSILIYEDFDDVIRCYNCALGEYYLQTDDKQRVSCFARSFTQRVWQLIQWFGESNVSSRVLEAYKAGGSRLNETITVKHLIEPTDARDISIGGNMPIREIYWEEGTNTSPGQVLDVRGYEEMPGIFPRWEVTGNDAYGTSPGMDALGDIIQLQHETKRKGQVLDYAVRPPTLSDITLAGRPTALLPGSNTFVANLANNAGVKPVFQLNPNIQEITADIRDVQIRVNEIFFNDLFKMISQLDTVRSATEIDARREEKLILLGPVLERFGNEALDKAINRVYGIMDRGRLLPPPPPSIHGRQIEIQYISILSTAQSAAGVAPTERFLQVMGGLAPLYPPALDLPNFDQILRNYGRAVGMKANEMNDKDLVLQIRQNKAQQQQAAQTADFAQKAAQAGQNLSKTDVGGGVNALQALMG
jgi:hypothetical protein